MNAIKLDVLINALTVMDYQTNINYTNLIVWSVYQHSDKKMFSTIISWLKFSCWLPGTTCLLLLDTVTSEFDVSCEDEDSGWRTNAHTHS